MNTRQFARRAGVLALGMALLGANVASAAATDSQVTTGSPPTPFSENKQNEPAVAIDAHQANVVVAGANDNIDLEACNAGNDTTCPFTHGVGVSGVYFSFDSGKHWTQPTYTGLSARNCQGVPGNTDPNCTPQPNGPIGTLPWYFENGLVSGGDPGLAFGPKPDSSGRFSWSNGSRLYYANLTSNLSAIRSDEAFNGFEAIAISRTDNVQAAAASDKSAWMPPVLISRQSSTTFSDKEQIWADNASSSPFFGNVYVCWASFRGQEKSSSNPAPLMAATSSDGGNTWSVQQVTPAANNAQRNPMDGCTVRTDSTGVAYIFGIATTPQTSKQAFEVMSRSFDGGKSWENSEPVVGPVTQPGILDPVIGRPTIDGVAGARSDLTPAPSVDIANGAPTGSDATNRIVMSFVSGEITKPHVYFAESVDGGNSWSTPRAIEGATDRGYYAAPAISPDGKNVYVVYNAFTTPYQATTATPRSLVGVLMSATAGATGATGSFSQVHRGAPGDPRGSSQNNLQAEFLGDYVYAAASRTYGVAVWNDVRNAADCPAVDAWRQSLRDGTSVPRPAPQQNCPPTWGNSDIFGFTTAP